MLKGLLLAWGIIYFDVWKEIYPEATQKIIKVLARVLNDLMPQQRWLKGLSTVVLAKIMISFQCKFIFITYKSICYNVLVSVPGILLPVRRFIIPDLSFSVSPGV